MTNTQPTEINQAMLQDEHIELTSTIAQHLSDAMTKINALEYELLKINERLAELSSIFADTVSGKGA